MPCNFFILKLVVKSNYYGVENLSQIWTTGRILVGIIFQGKVNFPAQRKKSAPLLCFWNSSPSVFLCFCNLAVLKDTYKSQVSPCDWLAEKNLWMEKRSFAIKLKSLFLWCLFHFSFYSSACIILTRTSVNSQDANLKLTGMVAKILDVQILLTD